MSDPYADAESGLQAGALVGQSVRRGTGSVTHTERDELDDVTELRVTTQVDEIVTTYAFTQIVSAKLWRDEAQRESLVRHMLWQPMPGFVRTDDDHRTAAAFGRMVHDAACTFGVVDGEIAGECVEGCAILPSDEADATLAMMRVEVNVRPDVKPTCCCAALGMGQYGIAYDCPVHGHTIERPTDEQ